MLKLLAELKRRVFATRSIPIEMFEQLGIRHVKGILLHGPPGTGKTLVARSIAKLLSARPPKLVNGPEVEHYCYAILCNLIMPC